MDQIDDGSIACADEEGEVSASPHLITQAMLSAESLPSLPEKFPFPGELMQTEVFPDLVRDDYRWHSRIP